MGEFIVSARKYRPENFNTLLGQENISVTLQNSIKKGQLAHAYLFCGPRGVGKTTTARIFAKAINCSDPDENMEPCGKCESCISFNEGRSFNIHELDAASNNSVDDIRALTEKVRVAPQIGKYSVYIIDEVHMLSQAAFNAFLKTLEEPPAHAVFILATTEKHKILPTILSRCQTYDFNRISIKDIVTNLTNIAEKESVKIEPDALHIIAQKADGAMRDALTLYDQTVAFSGNNITYEEVINNLNVLDYEYFFKLTGYFLEGDYASALILFDEVLLKGFNSLYFISGLSTHFRDLLVCKNSRSESLLEIAPTLVTRYKEQAESCSIQFLYEALGLTTNCEASYKSSGNPRLLIEFALVRLSYLNKKDELKTKVTSQPAPAAKPAPVEPIASEPVAIPPVSAPGTLSIKQMLANAGQKVEAEKEIETNDKELTYEELVNAWNKMAKNETRERVAAALKATQPLLNEDMQTVIFMVDNIAQKNWLEEKLRVSMEEFLRVDLKQKNLRLLIEVAPANENEDEENKKYYMPSQKAKFLLKNNPDLNELKKDLDLDVK